MADELRSLNLTAYATGRCSRDDAGAVTQNQKSMVDDAMMAKDRRPSTFYLLLPSD